jgi:ATPase subunit of ABC transporter with duplicated ATPase domains
VILVDLEGVTASRPGKPLFTDLSLTISTGDRLGIVGLNGGGKSTLLRVIVGDLDPESGVVRRGRAVRMAVLDQAPELPAGRVLEAVVPHAGERWEASSVLDRLGMGDLLEADTSTLSGGQAKRVALARTLVAEADLLVLDEPTNHLDIDAIAWLEDRLASFRGGLVLVTHDRHVLDRVTTRVLELDRGRGYLHEVATTPTWRAGPSARRGRPRPTRRRAASSPVASSSGSAGAHRPGPASPRHDSTRRPGWSRKVRRPPPARVAERSTWLASAPRPEPTKEVAGGAPRGWPSAIPAPLGWATR